MNDTLLEMLLACTLRGTLLIAIALIAGPWVRRLCGPNSAHWLWLAVLPVLLWPSPPRTPFGLGGGWKAPPPAVEAVAFTEDSAKDHVRAASTTAGEVSRLSRWSNGLTVIWALGAVVCMGHLGGRWWRTQRLLREARPITDERAAAVLGRFSKRGRVEIAVISSIPAPALAGIWRPRILLPEHWLEELSEAELESVLLHELGHHRRADLVWEWLFAIARCLHWMNPAVWLAERVSRQARELACDAWAMERSRYPEQYGAAVLNALQRMQSGPASANFGMAAMAAADARLMARRLKWIARGSFSSRWLAAIGWVPALSVLVMVGTDPVAAQTRKVVSPVASPPVAATAQERVEAAKKPAPRSGVSATAVSNHPASSEPPLPAKPARTFFERFFGAHATVARPPLPAAEWDLYPRGTLPSGAMLTAKQAAELKPGSYEENLSFLVGDYVVTAAGKGRAVLRPHAAPVSFRVVVEIAPGEADKVERERVKLDAKEAWLIRRVTRNADDQLTVFTRAITKS